MSTIFEFLLLLLWSFVLSALARIILDCSLIPKPLCASCPEPATPSTTLCCSIYWNGNCPACNTQIIRLTPWLELFSATMLYALLHTYQAPTLYAYFFLFSTLIITIKTDLEYMLISRFVSLFLIPVGVMLSVVGWLPISPFESMITALVAYALLHSISYIFTRITGKIGLGQGDSELLAYIGSFLGALGCWLTIALASTIGTVVGCVYLAWHKTTNRYIPFGPFLAFGSILFILFQHKIITFLLF